MQRQGSDNIGDERNAIEIELHRIVIVGGGDMIPRVGDQRCSQSLGGHGARPGLTSSVESQVNPRAVAIKSELVTNIATGPANLGKDAASTKVVSGLIEIHPRLQRELIPTVEVRIDVWNGHRLSDPVELEGLTVATGSIVGGRASRAIVMQGGIQHVALRLPPGDQSARQGAGIPGLRGGSPRISNDETKVLQRHGHRVGRGDRRTERTRLGRRATDQAGGSVHHETRWQTRSRDPCAALGGNLPGQRPIHNSARQSRTGDGGHASDHFEVVHHGHAQIGRICAEIEAQFGRGEGGAEDVGRIDREIHAVRAPGTGVKTICPLQAEEEWPITEVQCRRGLGRNATLLNGELVLPKRPGGAAIVNGSDVVVGVAHGDHADLRRVAAGGNKFADSKGQGEVPVGRRVHRIKMDWPVARRPNVTIVGPQPRLTGQAVEVVRVGGNRRPVRTQTAGEVLAEEHAGRVAHHDTEGLVGRAKGVGGGDGGVIHARHGRRSGDATVPWREVQPRRQACSAKAGGVGGTHIPDEGGALQPTGESRAGEDGLDARVGHRHRGDLKVVDEHGVGLVVIQTHPEAHLPRESVPIGSGGDIRDGGEFGAVGAGPDGIHVTLLDESHGERIGPKILGGTRAGGHHLARFNGHGCAPSARAAAVVIAGIVVGVVPGDEDDARAVALAGSEPGDAQRDHEVANRRRVDREQVQRPVVVGPGVAPVSAQVHLSGLEPVVIGVSGHRGPRGRQAVVEVFAPQHTCAVADDDAKGLLSGSLRIRGGDGSVECAGGGRRAGDDAVGVHAQSWRKARGAKPGPVIRRHLPDKRGVAHSRRQRCTGEHWRIKRDLLGGDMEVVKLDGDGVSGAVVLQREVDGGRVGVARPLREEGVVVKCLDGRAAADDAEGAIRHSGGGDAVVSGRRIKPDMGVVATQTALVATDGRSKLS